ncbi:MAG: protein translocase subunit SecF [Deltaproteobacteria bacterium]
MDLIKPGTNIDFTSRMKKAVFISWGLILIGVVSLFLHSGLNWGVEFVGGTEVHIKFAKDIDSDEVRSVLDSSGFSADSVQQLGLAQENDYLIRFSPEVVAFDKIQDFQSSIDRIIQTSPQFSGANVLRIDYIGPKVGAELIKKAIISLILGCVGILLYLMIRFEFEFALGAVVAIIHDVFITVGAISLMDKEFTLTLVAALLTIIGYSVNDTIIIFDRIRENLKRGTELGFKELINLSVNQTLARTVLTVFTVFVVLLALFFLGGPVIHDFAFTLIVGVLVGTFSSVFVATAFVLYWKSRKSALAQ